MIGKIWENTQQKNLPKINKTQKEYIESGTRKS